MLKDRKKKEVVVTDLIGNLAAQCFGAKLLKNLLIVRREVKKLASALCKNAVRCCSALGLRYSKMARMAIATGIQVRLLVTGKSMEVGRAEEKGEPLESWAEIQSGRPDRAQSLPENFQLGKSVLRWHCFLES